MFFQVIAALSGRGQDGNHGPVWPMQSTFGMARTHQIIRWVLAVFFFFVSAGYGGEGSASAGGLHLRQPAPRSAHMIRRPALALLPTRLPGARLDLGSVPPRRDLVAAPRKRVRVGLSDIGAGITIGDWTVGFTVTTGTDDRYDSGQKRERATQRQEEELGARLAGRNTPSRLVAREAR